MEQQSSIMMPVVLLLRIFFKQRDARFYPASAYVLGQTLTQVTRLLAHTQGPMARNMHTQ